MADFDVEILGLPEHPVWTVRVTGAPTAHAAGECATALRGGRVGMIEPVGIGPAPMDRVAYGQTEEPQAVTPSARPPRQGLLRRAWRPTPWGERTITEPDAQAIRAAVSRGVVVGFMLLALLNGAAALLLLTAYELLRG